MASAVLVQRQALRRTALPLLLLLRALCHARLSPAAQLCPRVQLLTASLAFQVHPATAAPACKGLACKAEIPQVVLELAICLSGARMHVWLLVSMEGAVLRVFAVRL